MDGWIMAHHPIVNDLDLLPGLRSFGFGHDDFHGDGDGPLAVARTPATSLLREREEPDPPDDVAMAGLNSDYESKVFCVRRNDPRTFSLCIGSGLAPRAWKQLGRFMRGNTHVTYFCLMACHLKGKSMVDLGSGLEHNESVSEFEISDCRLKIPEVRGLAPFIRKNPALRTLSIDGCLRAPEGGVELLASALTGRARSIESISLDSNFLGNEQATDAFDTLIAALNQNRELSRCSLMANAIGKSGCKSLTKLLKNPDTKLKSLILRHNYINSECAAILAEALSDNLTLNNIDLDRNQIKAKGLMAFLDLISKTPGATIQLAARWKCPNSLSNETTRVKIKINQPLHSMLLELSANHNVDISNVRLSAKSAPITFSRNLDISQTPFFYGLEEGDVIDVIHESGETSAAQTVPNVTACGQNCIHNTIASNHTLSSLGYETALHRNFLHGSLLREFLDANKGTDKRATLRTKLLRRHVQDHVNPDDFCEMDAVMQRVLTWIFDGLKDMEGGRTLEVIYCILRGMPMLCGS